MNPKSTALLPALVIGGIAGAASLYFKVKTAAIKHLNLEGAFKGIREERAEAMQTVTGVAIPLNIKSLDQQLEDENRELTDPQNVALNKINGSFRAKKRDIITSRNVDTFSGAWNTLSGGEKNRALGFSAVNSIVAGGLTYAVMNAARKSRSRKGGSSHDSTSGGSGCSYSSHRGGGSHGHGCGHGCGGGCGGG